MVLEETGVLSENLSTDLANLTREVRTGVKPEPKSGLLRFSQGKRAQSQQLQSRSQRQRQRFCCHGFGCRNPNWESEGFKVRV